MLACKGKSISLLILLLIAFTGNLFAGGSTSLSSNNIAAIAEDAQHNMWVGGQNGISVYRPVTTLMRTGKLVERATALNFNSVMNPLNGLISNNLLLPIPQSEIGLNKDAKLEQNPGY